MRRLLLVALVIVCGLALVGAAVVFMLLRPRSEEVSQDQPTALPVGGLTPAEESERSAAQLEAADSDSDGLINSEEAVWRSNPDVADTDGDGYLDGEEVRAGHDPIKKAPNDKLPGATPAPAAARPGAGAAPPAPLNVEQYLADDVDLTGGSANLTEEFERQYSETERTPAAMEEFASAKPVAELLPRPASHDLPAKTYPDAPETIAGYLDVADNLNVLSNQTVFLTAMSDLSEYNDSSAMQGLADSERYYREQLTATTVPVSALPLHTLLLGYSDALAVIFDRIARYPDDPVGSLAATRQLWQLDRKYYPLIHAEFARLRVLYDTLAKSD